jgi:hypothetical protein
MSSDNTTNDDKLQALQQEQPPRGAKRLCTGLFKSFRACKRNSDGASNASSASSTTSETSRYVFLPLISSSEAIIKTNNIDLLPALTAPSKNSTNALLTTSHPPNSSSPNLPSNSTSASPSSSVPNPRGSIRVPTRDEHTHHPTALQMDILQLLLSSRSSNVRSQLSHQGLGLAPLAMGRFSQAGMISVKREDSDLSG